MSDEFVADKGPEEWRDIKGFIGLFQISNYGRVRRTVTKDIIPQSPQTKGYLRVNVPEMHRLVHNMVLEEFCCPRPDKKMQARHLDDDKHNNHISNLAWGTQEENYEDRRRNMNRPLTDHQKSEIERRYNNLERTDRIARNIGITKRRVWAHIASVTGREPGPGLDSGREDRVARQTRTKVHAQMTVRLEPELAEAIDEETDLRGRSRSETIADLIQIGLEVTKAKRNVSAG
jgi:hypothetical protein